MGGRKEPLSQTLVQSHAIRKAALLIRNPTEYHIYATPYAAAYAAWAYVYWFQYDEWLGSGEVAGLSFLLVAAVNALLFLVCQWNVSAAARFTCRHTDDINEANYVKIVPRRHHGSGQLCPLEHPKRRRAFTANGEANGPWFFFQKRKYIWNHATKRFDKLAFPTKQGLPMSHFQNCRGLGDGVSIAQATQKYGKNLFDVPIPSFGALFKEHMMAPFFVFQLFCVALWFLDEMWYYSLFTLGMLFMFESTVVFQRLKNLQDFRNMSIKPYRIDVYRDERWVQLMTDELLPGDLVALTRSKEDAPIPCDLLLVGGTAIVNEAMLSGESTPQLKENISLAEHDAIFSLETDKNSVFYGGTKILQVTAPDVAYPLKDGPPIPEPPNKGCLAVVIRTGFHTQQGKLVRTIIYSSERMTADNLESLLFILFLLVFAVVAAWYVWTEGTKNEERKREKVLLDCILIITSVVPPELPMELSLAVNNSLMALVRSYVFCTEPFRIPFAGRIDVACFDKTGTLTAEDLVMQGVAGLGDHPAELIPVDRLGDLPKMTVWTLAAGHALVRLKDEGIVGDPMEKNALATLGWTLHDDTLIKPRANAKTSPESLAPDGLTVLRRWQFTSAMKRMNAIYQDNMTGDLYVAVKGAPETIQSMLKQVPEGYEQTYKDFARSGNRVLALAWRRFDRDGRPITDVERSAIEHDLAFGGFLVFFCPLKNDSAESIQMLNESSHRCVMITGDNALTACHVAGQVAITTRTVLVAGAPEMRPRHEALLDDTDADHLQWISVDEQVCFTQDLRVAAMPEALKTYDLCITGKALDAMMDKPAFAALLPRIWVYARVSPSQKEDILNALKAQGFTTLMCGDGTNDVGALKQAHVGIALLTANVEDLEKMNEAAQVKRKLMILAQQAKLRERFNMPPLPAHEQELVEAFKKQEAAAQAKALAAAENDEIGASAKAAAKASPTAGAANRPKPANLSDQFSEMLQAMNQAEMEDGPPQIKFGDASVAAPFTSKISSVRSVCNIIRQGRATLVAMIQMYKILALNSLISAYAMSVLYLAGIKQGDWQSTVAGLLMTVCFFGIAKSTPVERLSKKRPQSSVFNVYLVCSVLGQAAIHVGSLIYIRQQALFYSEELDEEIDLDAKFSPSLLNSAIYLISLTMQISTFAINYQGLPFRESLFQNKPLWNGLRMVGGITLCAATEFVPALNDWMQLVPFPEEFRVRLLTTMAVDLAGSWLIEQVCSALFSNNKPKAALM
ncbi:hypothetical protein CXG81DRAFT_24566 [Caulochytrium protostelioides]|uniref:Cation-transporting P-type ATPase N-terminal domain-containing protein n=1 Tax=Caulochytrium protostelioides TaxID=1555241 RepID=A0A4P9XBK6_9FUNG|nr:hypothetical protein CXG81DRAFT_24566 [Caulochytrium protostelioides]|eukprot:RKP02778.1 hypothetical protein CXG81DRAFT_24566 [Caulochytrium protostelioides]